MRPLRALLLMLCLALPLPLAAQQDAPPAPATLVADRIDFDENMLTASGAVEVFADGRILRATRITYLREEDRLLVEGPLTLLDGPDTIVIADFASLSSDLRNSILQGARLVLDQRLQIAATEIATGAEGRFTQLYQTVASSCEICAESEVPIWQIRAKRIIHDTEKRQLYFENARFEVAGIPVAWFPRLRLPDPTVERATGFLVPRFSDDGQLGTGITLPYFIALGPSRDLTLAPFFTTNDVQSLGYRYRQAFNNGAIEIEGAFSGDDIRPGELRGYVFAEGAFLLPRDYRLEFDIEAVTDETYLLDYEITEKDRLDSRLALTRIDREDRVLGEVIIFRSLRDGEENRFLPTRILTVERERRVPRPILGGDLVWKLQAHGRERSASNVPEGLPANSARDVQRASLALDWRATRVTGPGVVATAIAGVDVDAFNVRQTDEFDDDLIVRAIPFGGFELRMPLTRSNANGVRHLIEPAAQLIVAPSDAPDTPDEDSLTPGFDEGNLFSTQRFPGRDTRELGTRLNLGLSYTRYDPSGWELGGTVGRILRTADLDQFLTGSGLSGDASDWLVSTTAEYNDRFQLLQRSIFDDSFEFTRAETILRWQSSRHSLETRHTWLLADEEAGRPIDTSEWTVDAALNLTREWTGRANWRYDFVTDDPSRAGVGLTYQSECLTVDFDVERRFTSNDDLEPSTKFGLGVQLVGFGADERRDRRRRCGI